MPPQSLVSQGDRVAKHGQRMQRQGPAGPGGVVTTQALLNHYSGPLPSPAHFEAFERVLPGSAERILKMAETEQARRHATDLIAQRAYNRETATGQWFALVIGLVTVIAGMYAAVNGAQWPGGLIGAGGLFGLVSAFIYGRKSRK